MSFEHFAYEMDQTLARDLFMMIALVRTGELVGFVQTYQGNLHDGVVSFLLYLKERPRRRGFGAEAGFLLMDYLFNHFPYRKIYAEAYEFNTESRSAVENAGFVEEGCLREHVWYGGRYWNLYKFAFYRSDWPKLYARLGNCKVAEPASRRVTRTSAPEYDVVAHANGTLSHT
jgi:RimJ/RimL family protein N-acetyltransferase